MTPLEADQAALREARYRFLESVAAEVAADRLATGHQADDQAETVLFRLLRGCGVRGLAGIPSRRGGIARPLLPFRRAELRSWLESEGVGWLSDPSNEDLRWARARIRGRILPAADGAWGGGLADRLREIGDAAARAEAGLEERSGRLVMDALLPPPRHGWHEAVALDRALLLEAPPELRGRAVRRIARRFGVRMTGGGTRQANQFISAGPSGGRVDLGGGVVLAREFDRLVAGRPAPVEPDTTVTLDDLSVPGRARMRAGGRELEASWRRTAQGGGVQSAAGDAGGGDGALLALDRLEPPLRLRSWRDGDRLGTTRGERKLKELFRERRVPASLRSRLVLAEDASGRVAWVEGVGRDPGLAPAAGDRALSLRVEDV